MYFASDNTAGMTPEILEAIGRANVGYALGYGNDDWTKRVERRFAEIFEKEVAMFTVEGEEGKPDELAAKVTAALEKHLATGGRN